MLIALLIKLLFGGGADEYLIPSIEKYSKKNFDKEAKTIVVTTLHEHQADTKLFYKAQKKRIKTFHQQRQEKDIESEHFDEFYSQTISGFERLDSLSIVRRQIIIQHFSEQQWDEAMVKASKNLEKYLKQKHKTRHKLNKSIARFSSRVERLIANKGINPKTLEIVNHFETITNQYLDDYDELQEDLTHYWLNYTIDEQVLKAKMQQAIAIRKDYNSNFKTTFFELLEILNEKEWLMIRKQFNRIY
ncbi:hypothetical protein J1N10_13675 [Carboxylicivirga sp. A043]|uniref:hypothetical protein n=1 Tax=Carboxylicivirga litoralis TaxID=2816963 RepID=UPI0021CB5C17|nr:hypothetical protein [Carboxylicivirga sp. A043]MCU4157034.1 hypothetical protein [Carboxylicivirga sp. A043]